MVQASNRRLLPQLDTPPTDITHRQVCTRPRQPAAHSPHLVLGQLGQLLPQPVRHVQQEVRVAARVVQHVGRQGPQPPVGQLVALIRLGGRGEKGAYFKINRLTRLLVTVQHVWAVWQPQSSSPVSQPERNKYPNNVLCPPLTPPAVPWRTWKPTMLSSR